MKYSIYGKVSGTIWLGEVEAESEEAAQKQAEKEYHDYSVSCGDADSLPVESVIVEEQ